MVWFGLGCAHGGRTCIDSVCVQVKGSSYAWNAGYITNPFHRRSSTSIFDHHHHRPSKELFPYRRDPKQPNPTLVHDHTSPSLPNIMTALSGTVLFSPYAERRKQTQKDPDLIRCDLDRCSRKIPCRARTCTLFNQISPRTRSHPSTSASRYIAGITLTKQNPPKIIERYRASNEYWEL